MKKIGKLTLYLCFFTVFLSGCTTKSGRPLCRVVTQVDISCQQEDVHIHRHYTDSQKMEYVLLYLRLLKPLGIPDTNPEQIPADVYEITLQFSDGNRKIYRQKDHRYLAIGSLPWKTIDPGQAAGLYTLMRRIPSDQL